MKDIMNMMKAATEERHATTGEREARHAKRHEKCADEERSGRGRAEVLRHQCGQREDARTDRGVNDVRGQRRQPDPAHELRISFFRGG